MLAIVCLLRLQKTFLRCKIALPGILKCLILDCIINLFTTSEVTKQWIPHVIPAYREGRLFHTLPSDSQILKESLFYENN